MAKHDLAIRWSDTAAALRRLRGLSSIPLHGYPRHLRVPGGKIYAVGAEGCVLRVGTVTRVVGSRLVMLAGGSRRANGYSVFVKGGNLGRPTETDNSKVHIRWHAVGQFRYYDARTGHAAFIAPPSREVPDMPIENAPESREPTRHAYVRGIPGLPAGHPESILVDDRISERIACS